MNVMIQNFRQQFNELIQYIRFLERENRKLTKQIEKLKTQNR